MIYSDLYFLTLDNLTWVKIEQTKGQGALALADHVLLPCSETDFLVLGGIDPTYKLSNKITILTFTEERLWAYSHNSRPQKVSKEKSSISPKTSAAITPTHAAGVSKPTFKLSMASPSFIQKMPESLRYDGATNNDMSSKPMFTPHLNNEASQYL